MMLKNRFSLFAATFLIIGLFFLALPEKGFSGTSSATFGTCCIDLSDGECITCEFFACAYSKSFCEQELGGDFESGAGGVCVDDDKGPRCGDGDPEVLGCCVIEEGNCEDGVIRGDCFDEQGEGADFWVFNESCSDVPECAPLPKNVPTLSGWGLISLAVVLGILGIAGFIVMRKRKVTA